MHNLEMNRTPFEVGESSELCGECLAAPVRARVTVSSVSYHHPHPAGHSHRVYSLLLMGSHVEGEGGREL